MSERTQICGCVVGCCRRRRLWIWRRRRSVVSKDYGYGEVMCGGSVYVSRSGMGWRMKHGFGWSFFWDEGFLYYPYPFGYLCLGSVILSEICWNIFKFWLHSFSISIYGVDMWHVTTLVSKKVSHSDLDLYNYDFSDLPRLRSVFDMSCCHRLSYLQKIAPSSAPSKTATDLRPEMSISSIDGGGSGFLLWLKDGRRLDLRRLDLNIGGGDCGPDFERRGFRLER